ncbi:conserved hypothetical protein, partial [Arthrobacter sp. Hiyo6]
MPVPTTADTTPVLGLADHVARIGRSSRWELVGEVPLDFPTHHPQGMAFASGLIFLSSV